MFFSHSLKSFVIVLMINLSLVFAEFPEHFSAASEQSQDDNEISSQMNEILSKVNEAKQNTLENFKDTNNEQQETIKRFETNSADTIELHTNRKRNALNKANGVMKSAKESFDFKLFFEDQFNGKIN